MRLGKLFLWCFFLGAFFAICFLLIIPAKIFSPDRGDFPFRVFYPAAGQVSDHGSQNLSVLSSARSESGNHWKMMLDVTPINQNSFKHTWHENGYTHLAGCVPASFAMLIDYEVRRAGYTKIDFNHVMRQLRKQYALNNERATSAGNQAASFASKIKSYFKPIHTRVNMADKNFDMVVEDLELGNGQSAYVRLTAYPRLHKHNGFLSVVKGNLDRGKPIAVQTSALEKRYIDPPDGDILRLKPEWNPWLKSFPWTGGHEMVIMGYEANEGCTGNSHNICRLILNDTNSASPQYVRVYRAFWKDHELGVALWFQGEGGMNDYVFIVMGVDLDLIAVSELRVMQTPEKGKAR